VLGKTRRWGRGRAARPRRGCSRAALCARVVARGGRRVGWGPRVTGREREKGVAAGPIGQPSGTVQLVRLGFCFFFFFYPYFP
jgi:hypothetical protein